MKLYRANEQQKKYKSHCECCWNKLYFVILFAVSNYKKI